MNLEGNPFANASTMANRFRASLNGFSMREKVDSLCAFLLIRIPRGVLICLRLYDFLGVLILIFKSASTRNDNRRNLGVHMFGCRKNSRLYCCRRSCSSNRRESNNGVQYEPQWQSNKRRTRKNNKDEEKTKK